MQNEQVNVCALLIVSSGKLWLGRGKRRNESFQEKAEEPLGTNSHQTIS